MIDQTYCKACIRSKGRERREGEERGCEWVTMGDIITILVAIVQYTMFVGVSMCDVIELGNLSKTIKINICCRRKTSCSLFTYNLILSVTIQGHYKIITLCFHKHWQQI